MSYMEAKRVRLLAEYGQNLAAETGRTSSDHHNVSSFPKEALPSPKFCKYCGMVVSRNDQDEYCSLECLTNFWDANLLKNRYETSESLGKEFARRESEILHERAKRLKESAKLWAERGEYLSAHSESTEADLLHSIAWDMEARYNGPYKVNRGG